MHEKKRIRVNVVNVVVKKLTPNLARNILSYAIGRKFDVSETSLGIYSRDHCLTGIFQSIILLIILSIIRSYRNMIVSLSQVSDSRIIPGVPFKSYFYTSTFFTEILTLSNLVRANRFEWHTRGRYSYQDDTAENKKEHIGMQPDETAGSGFLSVAHRANGEGHANEYRQ